MRQLDKLNTFINLDKDVIEETERDIKINRIAFNKKTTVDDILNIANSYMKAKARCIFD